MDYYSDQPMPSLPDRKKRLLDYVLTLKNKIIPKEIDEIVNSIVSTTNEYSWTGYAIFGIKDENTKLLNLLKSN